MHTTHSKEFSLKSVKSPIRLYSIKAQCQRERNMLSREELAFQHCLKTIWWKWHFSSLKSRHFILFLVYTSFSLKVPSLFFSGYTGRKAKNFADCGISTIYSIPNYRKKCTLHICHHSAGKRKNPRYATRFPAFELQWCIWNTTSQLQAALQGHKQMVWYYSPDLGLPSVNRVVNHRCKIRDWKCKCVFLFLYQNVHDISVLLPTL